MDVEKFISKLLNTLLVFSTDLSLDSAVSKYFSTLKRILDELIPEKVVRIHQRPSDVWFDEECKISKCITRKLEPKYLRSHSRTDCETCFRQKNLHKCLCRKKSKEFWDLKLFGCKNKSVTTWKYINEVAGRGKAGESKGIEIGSFKKYLDDKIIEVKSVNGDLFQIEVSSRISVLDEFFEVDEEELVKMINNLPNKQCALDPIPTWLLKRIASLIAPFLVSIFNSSFKSGTVLQGLKLACVTPILKKPNLNQSGPSAYRPISLSYQKYGWFLERTRSYLVENDLFPRFQSAYRPFHSTETAIAKIHMDILKAADEGRFSLLILLDLSSAFDLVNHNILINKLYSKFGFKGSVLEWYKSYLNNRCYITNNSVRTNLFHLHTGVPQGSVIGPLLFNLYSSDLETIAQRHNLSFHQYADDTQFYSSCVPGETEQLQHRLSDCVDEMAAWMESNSLKLNRSKTEAIWFSSLRKVNKLPTKQIRILDTFISPSESVKSLGVFMDRDLSMNSYISKMLQTGFSALR